MSNYPFKRYALVTQSNDDTSGVAAYLPGNYQVAGVVSGFWISDNARKHTDEPLWTVVIEGRDNAGWTLDDYVLPRLASGLRFAREVDLSHPVLKEID